MSTPLPTAGLATEGLRIRLAATPRLALDLDLLTSGEPLLKTEAARACPVTLMLPDARLAGDDFVATSLFEAPDALVVTCAAAGIEARLTWRIGALGAIHMLIQLRTLDDGAPRDGQLALPILDHLHPGDLTRSPWHDPGLGPLGHSGRPLVRTGRYPLPHSWWSERRGVTVLARYAEDTQEDSRWQPVPTVLPIRLRSSWVDACELIFVACEPGWSGAFQALRQQVRAGVDLAEYQRADLQWYSEQWLQHFTFLYGSEIFDHARGRFDLRRLLEDGRRFGGYDSLLLWPQYPRIGIDERDQWAFYDDLPGGRAGLHRLAEQARAGGARVFIPYLPWDVPPAARHGRTSPAAVQLARVVAEIGADGVFLDTMESILPTFRQAIDRVRSGVVFCSEGQPDLSAIERVTGSWDQARHEHAGEIDLLRFLFPEHPRFMIQRHAIGAHRERVIDRALLNGAGLVVWQDVFGEVLPYTEGEAARVRGAVTLLRRYADCFRGADVRPLIPAAHPDLLANAFIAPAGRAVLTVYNDGDEAISGAFVDRPNSGRQRLVRVESDADGAIHEVPAGLIAPGQVVVFAGADTVEC